jgi:hypothetical protein
VVFPGAPVSSTNKPDRHNITEMLLKVALSVKQTLHTVSVAAKSLWPISSIIVSLLYINELIELILVLNRDEILLDELPSINQFIDRCMVLY